MLALGHETVCFVSLGPVALVLALRVFFVKNLLSSGYLGGGCGASAHPCEATASGLWSLGSSPPSTGSVVAVLVLGCLVLLAWTYHCFSLGAWSLDLASSSVACIPSPFHGLARCGGLCMSPIFEMLSVLFPGNMGSLVPSSVTFDSFSSSSSKHLHARAHTEERVGVLVWVFIHQLPWLLILQHGSQVSHTGSPSLLSLILLFILQVSILSEQMVFCVS